MFILKDDFALKVKYKNSHEFVTGLWVNGNFPGDGGGGGCFRQRGRVEGDTSL